MYYFGLQLIEVLQSTVFVILFGIINTAISESKRTGHKKINFSFRRLDCFDNMFIFTAFSKLPIWLTNRLQMDILLDFFLFPSLERSTVMESFQINVGNIVILVYFNAE